MAQAKVVVSSGDVRLELEGDQGFVESHLEKLLPMVHPSRGGDGGKGDNGGGMGTETKAKGAVRQILKSFFKEKNPGNAYEAIATVLLYNRQHEQKDEMSTAEIRAALLQAPFRPPDQMAQAVTDCRRRYGYIEAGSKKGFWRLSNQGETLVEIDLPRAKVTQ